MTTPRFLEGLGRLIMLLPRGKYGFGKSGVLFHARFPGSKLI